MGNRKTIILKSLGLFALAIAWVFFSTAVAGGVISGLPRSHQGEAPDGSRIVCIGIVLLVQVAIPFLLIAFTVRTRLLRIAGFFSVFLAMLICHRLLGFIAALDKAWRRGW